MTGFGRITSMLLALLVATSPAMAQQQTFIEQVDLEPIESLAVQVDGRLKSFGSHANTLMSVVSGSRSINEQSPSFTYIDLMLRPDAYEDADIVYVKNKLVRNKIADALLMEDPSLGDRIEAFRETGLVSPMLLNSLPP